MITLFQFRPSLGLPNPSPFCMKVETYLRMTDLEYSVSYMGNPTKAPKGKLPYIEDKGRLIADSKFIISYLESTYHHDLNATLTPAEKAISEAMASMLEEKFYWAVVYSRWIDDRYWPTIKKIFFGRMPPLVRNIAPGLIRKQVNRSLHEQGTGRHTADEIYRIANSHLLALSDYLENKPYFMGHEPTRLDATAYAFIATVVQARLETELKSNAMQYENLVAYCERMQQQYFSAGPVLS